MSAHPHPSTPTTKAQHTVAAAVAQSAQGNLLALAFHRVEPEARALSPERTTQLNLEVNAAALRARNALPALRTLRAELAKLPGLDLRAVDALEDYCNALLYVQARYTTLSNESVVAAATLGPQCEADLKSLEVAAVALAHAGLVPASVLGPTQSVRSRAACATAVVALVLALQSHWPQLEGRTALTAEQLEAMLLRANSFLAAHAANELGTPSMGDTAKLRQAVFSLFFHAYSEARAGVLFLRRAEGDAEEFAPSLYANRGNRGAPPAHEGPETPALSTAPGQPAAPTSPSTPESTLRALTDPSQPAVDLSAALTSGPFEKR